jgi:hypothetical protein
MMHSEADSFEEQRGFFFEKRESRGAESLYDCNEKECS